MDLVFYRNDSQFLNDGSFGTSSRHINESFIEVILNCFQLFIVASSNFCPSFCIIQQLAV